VSSYVERYFVELAAKADYAVLKTLEHKALADSLAELRKLDATK
jgi:Rrf2 family transcriptional regulator, repressor of oqxAB